MGGKKTKKTKRCNIKCGKCEFYDSPFDYCTKKEIEECSKQTHLNFSQCDSFLIREDLIMY